MAAARPLATVCAFFGIYLVAVVFAYEDLRPGFALRHLERFSLHSWQRWWIYPLVLAIVAVAGSFWLLPDTVLVSYPFFLGVAGLFTAGLVVMPPVARLVPEPFGRTVGVFVVLVIPMESFVHGRVQARAVLNNDGDYTYVCDPEPQAAGTCHELRFIGKADDYFLFFDGANPGVRFVKVDASTPMTFKFKPQVSTTP